MPQKPKIQSFLPLHLHISEKSSTVASSKVMNHEIFKTMDATIQQHSVFNSMQIHLLKMFSRIVISQKLPKMRLTCKNDPKIIFLLGIFGGNFGTFWTKKEVLLTLFSIIIFLPVGIAQINNFS